MLDASTKGSLTMTIIITIKTITIRMTIITITTITIRMTITTTITTITIRMPIVVIIIFYRLMETRYSKTKLS